MFLSSGARRRLLFPPLPTPELPFVLPPQRVRVRILHLLEPFLPRVGDLRARRDLLRERPFPLLLRHPRAEKVLRPLDHGADLEVLRQLARVVRLVKPLRVVRASQFQQPHVTPELRGVLHRRHVEPAVTGVARAEPSELASFADQSRLVQRSHKETGAFRRELAQVLHPALRVRVVRLELPAFTLALAGFLEPVVFLRVRQRHHRGASSRVNFG